MEVIIRQFTSSCLITSHTGLKLHSYRQSFSNEEIYVIPEVRSKQWLFLYEKKTLLGDKKSCFKLLGHEEICLNLLGDKSLVSETIWIYKAKKLSESVSRENKKSWLQLFWREISVCQVTWYSPDTHRKLNQHASRALKSCQAIQEISEQYQITHCTLSGLNACKALHVSPECEKCQSNAGKWRGVPGTSYFGQLTPAT